VTAHFHLTVPVAPPAVVTDLPAFVTDVRPSDHASPQRGAAQAAAVAELAGLGGAFVPFRPDGLDPLVTAAGLLRRTSRVQVTAELHPATATPVYAAKLSASLQRFHANRLAWLLTVGLEPAVARAHGDFLTGPDRYARASEFLTVAKGVWNQGGSFSYEGRFFQVLDGGLPDSRSAPRFPRIYLSGTSPEALALSAEHADVHLLQPGDDPALVPAHVARGVVLSSVAAGVLDRYLRAGVSEFFLDGTDPVADALRVGEYLLPELVPAS